MKKLIFSKFPRVVISYLGSCTDIIFDLRFEICKSTIQKMQFRYFGQLKAKVVTI